METLWVRRRTQNLLPSLQNSHWMESQRQRRVCDGANRVKLELVYLAPFDEL